MKHPLENPKSARRWGWAIGLSLLVAVFLGGVMLLEKHFLFFPAVYPDGYDWAPDTLDFEDVEFESADGTALHGWYIPHPEPLAYVLYCHGNGGNITHRIDILADLRDQAGVSVFIFDYRGYGRSEGSPHEDGIYADARAARAWLAEREGIDESEIILMGRSLGGAVAVELASTDGAKALILESTFTSIPDMAKVQLPWLPIGRLLRNRFESIDKIGDYAGPLLQSHGDADTLVPYEQGERLFEAANEPKTFYTISGGDHNDLQPAEFYVKMVEFLEGVESEEDAQ